MNQIIASRCYYCGRSVSPQEDDYCPHCHYPTSPAKEEAYLTTTLANLQQAMSFGGAQLKVADLYQRYQKRLQAIQKLAASTVSPTSAAENIAEAATSTSVRVTSVVYQMHRPGQAEAHAPQVPAKAPQSARLFSWRSFLADNAITIIASLGAFLVLAGALSFVAATSSLLLAFLIVFAVHAVFGVTGIVTHRFTSFRIVSGIYTVIFALLIPLVGFSAYRLIVGSQITLSVPVVIAIAAAYAAIVYIMLAIFQRYALFAHFGMAALAVADLALASALNLAFWWWPSMLMILAFLAQVSVARSPAIGRLFDGNRDILRRPVRMFMYVFIVMGTIGMALVAFYSVILDGMMSHSSEAGYAILCVSILRLVWSMSGFYLARRTRNLITLAFLFLICALAFCYALKFDATGYALALTLVALFYAGISRFAVQLLHPFGALELQLDWMALALVLLVPFIAIPALPSEVAQMFTSGAAVQANWQGVGAILAGLILTLSIAFKRASYDALPRQSSWRWLLLPATFLYTCAAIPTILTLHFNPLWSFLGISVALVVGTVLVRRYAGGAWADPLDISALCIILITLGLSINAGPELLRRLLFCYFAAIYAILLYQQRAKWLFIPAIFASGALLLPGNSFQMLLILALALAMLAVAVHRFAGSASSAPLVILALLAGVMTGFTGMIQHSGATAIALLVFALLAYIAGVVEETTLPMWLTPCFATWSVIVSLWFLNDFLRAPIVALVAALSGMAVSLYQHEHGRTERPRPALSAVPFYITALLAALLTAFWPQGNLVQATIVSYSLFGFTALALAILLVERIPELLIFPVACAAGAAWFWHPHPDFTSLMIAYTGLCALVFATQFAWRVQPHRKMWLAPTTPHEILGIGGQALVIIVILSQGGFFASAGILAHVGAGALLMLAIMTFACGLLRPHTTGLWLPGYMDIDSRLKRIQATRETQRRCYYIAGLLLSLVVSWELSAFHQVRLDVLLLAPASYLIVAAPFLMRDTVIRERRMIGHLTAILGVCLLLLPALWFSFNDDNFVPTALLLGESLALLILGGLVRVRIFILSSAALVIVGTLRALFLATPPSLTLMITGVLLLLIATALILVRRKLQIAWKQWE